MTKRMIKPARIVTELQQLGLRIEDIAYHLGCSASAIRNWEQGRKYPIRVFSRRLEELLETERSKHGGRTEGKGKKAGGSATDSRESPAGSRRKTSSIG